MFHVLLVLPGMAAFGAAAGAVLVIMVALLCGAFLLVLLLGLFCRTIRWLLWLPVLFGSLGLLLCLTAGAFPLTLAVILGFWGLFGFMLLCGWLAAWVLKKIYFWIRG